MYIDYSIAIREVVHSSFCSCSHIDFIEMINFPNAIFGAKLINTRTMISNTESMLKMKRLPSF